VHNYGGIPATIETVSAKIYTTDPSVFRGSFPLAGQGRPAPGVVEIEADGLGDLSGETIPSGGAAPQSDTVATLPKFTIYDQKTVGEGFGFFPKWLRITVAYRDPYGAGRETGYMVRVDTFHINPVRDQKYSYEK
jgi:hypothetical protein